MSGDSQGRGRTIACIHLYDDYSGSSNVFAQALTVLEQNGHRLLVVVGDDGGGIGFIRAAHRVQTIPYRLAKSRLRLLLNFSLAQVRLFYRVSRLCLFDGAEIVYVNTVLPVGATLAGRLWRRRVVVHLHEVGLGSASLFRLLLSAARRCADEMVCVSEYLAGALGLPTATSRVVHNSLSPAHWAAAQAESAAAGSIRPEGVFVVVMACSLRWYKGLDSFVELARRFVGRDIGGTTVHFELLLNARADEFDEYTRSLAAPANLSLMRQPASVFDHFHRAGLVLNLSHPEGWIETFGLTLLEAMACGVPVVCPLQGGCVELFEPGQGGWRIGSRDLDRLESLIGELAADLPRWRAASAAARRAAQAFAPEQFARCLRAVFEPAR